MKTLYIFIIIIILLFGVLAGIIYLNNQADQGNQDNQIIGGDKDEHDCIGSAGYTWNNTKQECVREWEETLKQECINLGCEQNMLFVGSKNSDKYYNCDCGWAKTINPENLICFASDEQALADNRIKSEC